MESDTRRAPYHPATNGLAERAVQTFKDFIKKPSNHSLQTNISHFLFQYRITPHSTTGISPAELLLGRRPRSLLDLAISSVSSRVTANQEKQKQFHDKSSKGRSFKVGDLVYIRDFPSGKSWLPGVIESACGPLTYRIKLSDGRSFRRHIDHIRSRSASAIELSTPPNWMEFPATSDSTTSLTREPPNPSVPLRRSTRISVPPNRLEPTI